MFADVFYIIFWPYLYMTLTWSNSEDLSVLLMTFLFWTTYIAYKTTLIIFSVSQHLFLKCWSFVAW